MRDELINNFLRISKIPRGSGKEKQISDFFSHVAKNNNLFYYQDKYNNLLIKKKGNIPGDTIILEAHMDMVCVKEKDSIHNFDTDGINVIISGDNVFAKDTTLGADQGVGLAFMLTLIESNNIKHPDLEFMFTTEEETTFNGAINFPYDKVVGKKLINLDYDKDDVIVVASTGDVLNEYVYEGTIEKRNIPSYKITFTTNGGNSGVEITKAKYNAIYSLASILKDKEIYLKSINGGVFENDIADTCELVLQTNDDILSLKNDNIKIEMIDNDESFSLIDTTNIINEILCLESGYLSNTASANLGIIKTTNNKVIIDYLIRSTDVKEIEIISNNINNLNYNFKVFEKYTDDVWKVNKESSLYKKYNKLYYDMYHEYPKEEIVHGGLEIASIVKRIKDLEAISIGANMENIHTTREITHISSWKKIFNLLINLLA